MRVNEVLTRVDEDELFDIRCKSWNFCIRGTKWEITHSDTFMDNHFYEEERNSLISESATFKRKCESLEKANQTLLSFYNEDSKKIYDLQNLNNKLVKSNKAANRDFFILAAAYVATLMLMIYLFIR